MEVIQTVREKFTCRSCEKDHQHRRLPCHCPPRAGATAGVILYANSPAQPFNRQSDVCREGVTGCVDPGRLGGACSATLAPLVELIRRHVLAAADPR